MSLEFLSERERQVAYLVGRAYSNKMIARELNLSERTVDIHVANARKKLKLQNRVALALAVHGIDVNA